MTSRTIAAGCAIAVLLFALAYLAPSIGGSGPLMDEGAVVAYSERVLDGSVPHRDFLTFYGPGNLWIVAGAFGVFSESVATERAVGMAYRLVVVLSLLLIGLRLAGVAAGALAGIVAAALMGHELIWAYATYGALAFGLLGMALISWSGTAADQRWRSIGLVAAGLAGGAAVLVRFDFAPAVLLGALPLLSLAAVRARWWYAGGFLGAMTLYAFHLVLVGMERIARAAGDLVASGPGRRIPIPGPSAYPGSLLALSLFVLGLFLVVGALLWRGRRYDPVPQLLVSVGLFGVALLPYVLSRADEVHIQPFAVVPLSLLPAFALFAVRVCVSSARLRQGALAGVVLLTLATVVEFGDFTVNRARELRDVRHANLEFVVESRRAPTDAVLARTRALTRSGETLFVGPEDLRRTNYGPTFMYFLLRDLRPASYYMEMNPGTANREGSGLADELRRADWLILTSEWDDWDEPNESMDFGPSEPNDVVREDFCLRFERGEYRLYERCGRSA